MIHTRVILPLVDGAHTWCESSNPSEVSALSNSNHILASPVGVSNPCVAVFRYALHTCDIATCS